MHQYIKLTALKVYRFQSYRTRITNSIIITIRRATYPRTSDCRIRQKENTRMKFPSPALDINFTISGNGKQAFQRQALEIKHRRFARFPIGQLRIRLCTGAELCQVTRESDGTCSGAVGELIRPRHV